jgi:drug/metabolite transporter (DMT)-like permease
MYIALVPDRNQVPGTYPTYTRTMASSEAGVAPGRPSGYASLDAFSPRDWLLLAGTALTWGSSFVWIEIALRDFAPPLISLLRLVLGAGTLALFRAARAPVERADLRAVAWLGLLWMAAPFLLFPIAQQWIDSSVAGMINGGVPIVAGLVSVLVLRRRPPTKTILGIAIGFVGVIVVGWPAAQDSAATALGILLVVIATTCYGIAINIAVPLQRKYGSLPVLLRAQLVALTLTLIPGLVGATRSDFDWNALAALIPLGCLGTGLAFVWLANLIGHVGAARGSVTVYFVPVIAIVLGAVILDESISPVSLVGTALVIAGAFLTSRNQAAPG